MLSRCEVLPQVGVRGYHHGDPLLQGQGSQRGALSGEGGLVQGLVEDEGQDEGQEEQGHTRHHTDEPQLSVEEGRLSLPPLRSLTPSPAGRSGPYWIWGGSGRRVECWEVGTRRTVIPGGKDL